MIRQVTIYSPCRSYGRTPVLMHGQERCGAPAVFSIASIGKGYRPENCARAPFPFSAYA
jgi:hypothetical protein